MAPMIAMTWGSICEWAKSRRSRSIGRCDPRLHLVCWLALVSAPALANWCSLFVGLQSPDVALNPQPGPMHGVEPVRLGRQSTKGKPVAGRRPMEGLDGPGTEPHMIGPEGPTRVRPAERLEPLGRPGMRQLRVLIDGW